MISAEDYRSILIPNIAFTKVKFGDYIDRAERVKLFKGEYIGVGASGRDDPYFYYVEQGQIVGGFERESGDVVPLFWRNAGNAFSAEYQHLASIGRYKARFTATENTILYAFSQRLLYELMQEDPELFYEFVFVCHMSFAQMAHRLSGTSGQTSIQRMIMWLQKLCSVSKPDKEGVFKIDCDITLQEISDLLFIHVTTTTKLIAALEEKGIIRRTKTHIFVYDSNKLAEMGLEESNFSY
jgi:CRP/FNR family cyclic AMP-dependent transcriptional regulator